jgi:hypothetical protein
VCLTACSPGSGPGGGGGRDGGGGSGGDGSLAGAEGSHASCGDGVDNDGDGYGDCADLDCAAWTECGGSGDGGPGGGTDGGETCGFIMSTAMPTYAPVDIIFTIDNSGSMSEEASLVQEQVDDFTADIVASGVNFRVVLITAAGFVTVDPALASDPMRFRRIEASVSSHDSFEVILNTFSMYSDFLRPSARTHIVVVTDDESDTSETSFRSSMEASLGHSFTFHAVASEDTTHCEPPGFCFINVPGCAGPRGEAADIGAAYYRLAFATSGTVFSICSVDWSPLWTTLRESVLLSASVPCVYALPEPEPGMVFDRERVNVVFTDSGGGTTTYPRAIDMSRCTDAGGGPVRAWYYDNNDAPTQILLCPAACMQVESAGEGASMQIQLGCETEIVLI